MSLFLGTLACSAPHDAPNVAPPKETVQPTGVVEGTGPKDVPAEIVEPDTIPQPDAGMVNVAPKAPQGVAQAPKPQPTKTVSPQRSVFEMPKSNPKVLNTCQAQTDYSEKLYAKALKVATSTSCKKSSDCTVAQNTSRCIKRSPCKVDSYVGVHKRHAKQLKQLRSDLYQKVCPTCVRYAYKCAKPAMNAVCQQNQCVRIDVKSAFNLGLKVGRIKPYNPEMQKRFTARHKIFERCARGHGQMGTFDGGTLRLAVTLKEDGRVSEVKALQNLRQPKVTQCVIQKIKPYRFPKPQVGQNRFEINLVYK
ncbi:MAG: hypothetical protein CMH56_07035 [Myxococcales bacterium]|nr:hypothetical protein [Myxococcales bacterium]